MRKKVQIYLWLLGLLLVLAAAAGFILTHTLNGKNDPKDDNPLVAQRIKSENPADIKLNFSSLRNDLEVLVEEYKEESGDDIHLFFEYLPTGVELSVEGDQEVAGASLLKVPNVMLLYKAVEDGKLSLNQAVTIMREDIDTGYGDLYKRGEGFQLTLAEAVELALQDSDNTAMRIINRETSKYISRQDLINYIDLDFTVDESTKVTMISPRSYSYILKCLYLACYNTVEDSNTILDHLTQSKATNRLTNLLPSEVLVAHKIGTFSEEYKSDCGIIYANESKASYTLCIMVRGTDPEASREIARISYKVYSYVESLSETRNTDD